MLKRAVRDVRSEIRGRLPRALWGRITVFGADPKASLQSRARRCGRWTGLLVAAGLRPVQRFASVCNP